MGEGLPNGARYVFLGPTGGSFTALVGELPTRSEPFRQLWARHAVAPHPTGSKRLHHPVVGDLTLTYEAFDLPADPGQRIQRLHEPGSPDAESLGLLTSWASQPYTAAPAGKD